MAAEKTAKVNELKASGLIAVNLEAARVASEVAANIASASAESALYPATRAFEYAEKAAELAAQTTVNAVIISQKAVVDANAIATFEAYESDRIAKLAAVVSILEIARIVADVQEPPTRKQQKPRG
jgi:hypothetical protein